METSGMSFNTMILFFNNLKNVFFHISKYVRKEIRKKSGFYARQFNSPPDQYQIK